METQPTFLPENESRPFPCPTCKKEAAIWGGGLLECSHCGGKWAVANLPEEPQIRSVAKSDPKPCYKCGIEYSRSKIPQCPHCGACDWSFANDPDVGIFRGEPGPLICSKCNEEKNFLRNDMCEKCYWNKP